MAARMLTEQTIHQVTQEAAREARDCGLDDEAFALLVTSKLRLAADQASLEAGRWAPGMFTLAWTMGELSERLDHLQGLVEHLEDTVNEIHAATAPEAARLPRLTAG